MALAILGFRDDTADSIMLPPYVVGRCGDRGSGHSSNINMDRLEGIRNLEFRNFSPSKRMRIRRKKEGGEKNLVKMVSAPAPAPAESSKSSEGKKEMEKDVYDEEEEEEEEEEEQDEMEEDANAQQVRALQKSTIDVFSTLGPLEP